MSPVNDDAPAPPVLPIRVGTSRANFHVTYICKTAREAGEAVRDFRRAGAALIAVSDHSGRRLRASEVEELVAMLLPQAELAAVA